jgi:polysaccharide pyruvyl transferase WcaK-like protein
VAADDDRRARRVLVVSMRGDRPPVSAAWLDAVRRYAEERGLQTWVVTQVRRDADRSADLAQALDAQLLNWNGTGHLAQEQRLRQLYRRADAAISDRLHVLVAAYTHGTVPIALLMDGSEKIARHFAAAGIDDVAVHAPGLDAAVLVERMHAISRRAPEILAALPATRQALEAVRLAAANCLPDADKLPGHPGSRTA